MIEPCILGLLSPKSGSIHVLDLNQPESRQEIIKRTGFLIEGPHFYANLTCHENLKLLEFYYDLDRNRIEVVLKRMGLWEFKDRLYGKCSTGMKQRLGIAKSFLYNPELLILDEPLNGLDPEWIVETRMILKDQSLFLKSTHHITVFLIENNLEKYILFIYWSRRSILLKPPPSY